MRGLAAAAQANVANAEGEAEAFPLKGIPELFLKVTSERTALSVISLPINPFVVDAALFEGVDPNNACW